MLIGHGRPSRGRSPRKVWGDPFADDGWQDVVRTVDWADLDESELFRFMPNLRAATSGMRPNPLRSAFERCINRADRTVDASGCPTTNTDYASEDHHEGVALVRKLARRPIEATVQYSERDATRVALVSGVHPAFVWQEALVSHDRFATLAWLGCLGRARRALVPPEVARYIVDVFQGNGKCITVRDTTMSRLLSSNVVSRALLGAAKRRLTRKSVVFDLDSLAIRAVSSFGFTG